MMRNWALSRWRPCRPGRAVSRPSNSQMSIRTGSLPPCEGRKTPVFSGHRAVFLPLDAKSTVRELDPRLAGRDLLVILVAHQHIDHDPARFSRGLLRLDDADRLDGVAGFDRLQPAR